ncbi:ATP-dependent endonuclease [Escherichia coli]
MNKLSLNKICLLGNGYKKLDKIDSGTVKNLKRLPGYDTLRAVLSAKIILVEGPSDELILKKYYLEQYGKLPEEDGIDIIVVRGIGFKNYLEIVKHIEIKTNVMKDNDGDYKKMSIHTINVMPITIILNFTLLQIFFNTLLNQCL